MLRLRLLLLLAAGLAVAGCKPSSEARFLPHRYVDPRIGTAPGATESARRHSEADNEPRGQTFPAVGAPFALTNWTPETRAGEAKCVAPYYYNDPVIRGFRASHFLTGSCVQDYGSVTFMPVSGRLRFGPADRASAYDHAAETATPAYYSVVLARYGIRAEVTAGARTGYLRFTYARADSAWVVVQPNSDEGEGFVEIHPQRREIVGYNPVHRIYQGAGQRAGFSGYWVAVFDAPFAERGAWRDSTLLPDTLRAAGGGKAVGAYVRLLLTESRTVRVRVGTSFTSLEAARRNLQAESPGIRFERLRANTEGAWNEALGRVEVAGAAPEALATFYTALYHTMLAPRLYTDASGAYPGFAGGALQQAEGFQYYDDFSAWDTFRAAHPLYVLLDPERARDMARSLVAKADQGGWMPIFPCWNSYTAAMIGDHAAAILADAYLKGIRGFEEERAFAHLLRNATRTPPPADYRDGKGRRALASYLRYGYIPLEDSVWDAFHRREQVSRTLEYAYDDFALAQLAGALGRAPEQAMLARRAGNYRRVIDPAVGFARGRHADGRWAEPFDPAARQPYITEGTPWQYTWFAPHDVAGLMALLGGRARFVGRLDTLFGQGLYWHGNEPGHHIPYLYAYAGAPWKTQRIVAALRRDEYGPGPGGLSGNDDAGQMSAWYVFSAMGFYPVAPGLPHYVLGAPAFDRVTLRLEGRRRFTITAPGAGKGNVYIQEAWLNGEPLTRPWLSHDEIASGGELRLRMGPSPNPAWGSRPEDAPPSFHPPGVR